MYVANDYNDIHEYIYEYNRYMYIRFDIRIYMCVQLITAQKIYEMMYTTLHMGGRVVFFMKIIN